VPDPQTTSLDAALADDRLTVVGLLAEAFAGLEARSSAQLGAHGLSGVEFEVLLRLARSPLGLLRMSDLSAQTTLTSSGVTRVVDRLVDRGLVARQACATDRRTTYAVVTDAGRSLLTEVLPGHLALIESSLLDPLRRGGADELEAFVTALRRLRDHLAPCSTVGSEGPFPQQAAAAERSAPADRPEAAQSAQSAQAL
jgi:MarR family transcriptional regulator, 2-MHQ and catechol-resistance regulon repressor